MSKAILIIGESGAGKTTSMRKLNPEETFYIDCDGKGLNWKKWKEQYSIEKKNYIKSDVAETVLKLLRKISDEQKHIKNVVIDTLNGIMIADENRRRKEKNYDKWSDLAFSILDILVIANNLREDLNIICVGHSETLRDDFGYVFTRMKVSGQKLLKIVPESKMTTVLLAKCIEGKYIFETKNNNNTVKAPLGAFETETIENDIVKVLEALKEY